MQIVIRNNNTLLIDDFKFKCALGKKGSHQKIEGDKKTPKGVFNFRTIYLRKDRIFVIETKLKTIEIKKDMGWCDDVKSKYYNKIIKISEKN